MKTEEKIGFDVAEYDNNYHFYYNTRNSMVVCTTAYKGKTIRGVAKCSPEDTFDLEVGKKLAYLRCRYKFAKKKAAQASGVYAKAFTEALRINKYLDRVISFISDTGYELAKAQEDLAKFEHELNI
jgi:hypothetical protein